MVQEMSDLEMHQDMGSVKAQLEVLNREMKELKTDVRQIRDDFSQVKGGWRTLIGVAAILGAGVSWIANHLFQR
jgi:hypothetical protein